MRSALPWLIPLLLLGCSSPTPAPPAAAVSSQAAADAPTEAKNPAVSAEPAAVEAVAIDPLYGAVASGAETPSAMLNRYIFHLLNKDKAGSNAAWAYAPADPRHADDAVLRLLPDVSSLRLDSDIAVPRDDGQPPRLLEIPVRVRAATAQGTFRYHGWYRVQPSADGRSWQIQSAKLQPTLD